jgi:hypothetical protein
MTPKPRKKMTDTTSPENKALADLVAKIPRHRFEEMTRKERVQMSVLNVEKESIRETADRFGLSITGYLLALHALVVERLREEGRRR